MGLIYKLKKKKKTLLERQDLNVNIKRLLVRHGVNMLRLYPKSI